MISAPQGSQIDTKLTVLWCDKYTTPYLIDDQGPTYIPSLYSDTNSLNRHPLLITVSSWVCARYGCSAPCTPQWPYPCRQRGAATGGWAAARTSCSWYCTRTGSRPCICIALVLIECTRMHASQHSYGIVAPSQNKTQNHTHTLQRDREEATAAAATASGRNTNSIALIFISAAW